MISLPKWNCCKLAFKKWLKIKLRPSFPLLICSFSLYVITSPPLASTDFTPHSESLQVWVGWLLTFDSPNVCHEIQAVRLIVHHVVPQPLGQLLVPLYGEVEAVVSEEGHVDLPILLMETKNINASEEGLMECVVGDTLIFSLKLTKPKASSVMLGMMQLFSVWRFSLIHLMTHIVMVDGVGIDYREAGRVSVFQEGLKNDGKVVPEETVGEQQLLKSFLWMKVTQKNLFMCYLLLYLLFQWVTITAIMSIIYMKLTGNVLGACNSLSIIVFD